MLRAAIRLLVVTLVPLLAVASSQAPAPSTDPLVPCVADTAGPCVVVASQISDIVGVWKQYFGAPIPATPDGMAYIRYQEDGSYALADSPENTGAPYDTFPYGTVSFDGNIMTITVAEPPPDFPGCESGTYVVRVFKLGGQPVALHYTPVDDACAPRVGDLAQPLVWVAD